MTPGETGKSHICRRIFCLNIYPEPVLPQGSGMWLRWRERLPFQMLFTLLVWGKHRNCCLELSTPFSYHRFKPHWTSFLIPFAQLMLRDRGKLRRLWWPWQKVWTWNTTGGSPPVLPSFTMDSYRSYRNSSMQNSSWMDGEDKDVYEVESRVPLPRPFPLSSTLNEKNAIVVQTQISHVNHKMNGHLLKVVSKISLPTPPYTVSWCTPSAQKLSALGILKMDLCAIIKLLD